MLISSKKIIRHILLASSGCMLMVSFGFCVTYSIAEPNTSSHFACQETEVSPQHDAGKIPDLNFSKCKSPDEFISSITYSLADDSYSYICSTMSCDPQAYKTP